MKKVTDEYMDASEDLALAGMKAMKAFLSYQGENMQYFHKAKIGAVAATNFVRLRATETNRMAVELQSKRGPYEMAPGIEPVKQLPKRTNGHA